MRRWTPRSTSLWQVGRAASTGAWYRSGSEHCLALAGPPRHDTQKRQLALRNNRGLTWQPGVKPGSKHSLTWIPSGWSSLMRPAPRPRWRGSMGAPSAVPAAGHPCRTATGKQRPSPARCACLACAAPMVLDSAMTSEWFTAYVRQILAPTLRPGDIVILDNLLPQGRCRSGSHPSCRRDTTVPAALLAGLQPNRECLLQAQGAPAEGCDPHHRRALGRNPRCAPAVLATGMCQLLHRRRI